MKRWLIFLLKVIAVVAFFSVLAYIVLWIPVLHKLYDPCAYYQSLRCD